MTVTVKQSHVKMLGLVVFLLFILTIGLLVNSQRNSSNIDKLDDNVAEIRQTVRRLDHVASDIEDQTPEEQAQNEAISRAVEIVPDLKIILCDAFPQANGCT